MKQLYANMTTPLPTTEDINLAQLQAACADEPSVDTENLIADLFLLC